jgi:N-acetylglucosaminyldiphosphoundecaprenol N-acetyl-beta-D-mannosaminyltransferase
MTSSSLSPDIPPGQEASTTLPSVTAPEKPFEEIVFLRVPFSIISLDEACRLIAARPPGAPLAYVVTPNAQNLVRHSHLEDPRFIAFYEKAWLHLMDGKVPRALARQVFGLDIPLAAGSDLTAHLFETYIRPDDAITIIGGEVEMVDSLKARFHLTNVAHHNPPMGFINKPDEVEKCVRFILDHPARYIFMAAGSPRSEYVTQLVDRRGGAVGTALCIGSSLNFLTGHAKRANPVFRKLGLEWLYRLIVSPQTHIRRVFVESMPVLLMVAKARMNPAEYGMDRSRAGTGTQSRK